MEGRLHSTVHSKNNRLGISAIKKSENLGKKFSTDSNTFFEKIGKDFVYFQKYEKHPEIKKEDFNR